ncbi:Smr/MutS family protein [Thalassococcus sp. BH17M4-6]|uniref:Smr/MutS family protein n=1 Tax=Thalassococcus sp. BH17M4-6 TaxID=3413148 RepID=UPI003BBDF69C
MKRRKLREDELELWRQVARTADKLPGGDRLMPEETSKLGSVPPQKSEFAPDPLPRFQLGQTAPKRPESQPIPKSPGERLLQDGVRMDKKAHTRLKRGKLVPEARIDLHGMTLDQAHPALVRFLMTSFTRGLRLVLVITGKGQRADPYDPMPLRRGVLKQQVPMWLRMPPVAQVVLQVTEAHIRHGGSGAYYVYLRRDR